MPPSKLATHPPEHPSGPNIMLNLVVVVLEQCGFTTKVLKV